MKRPTRRSLQKPCSDNSGQASPQSSFEGDQLDRNASSPAEGRTYMTRSSAPKSIRYKQVPVPGKYRTYRTVVVSEASEASRSKRAEKADKGKVIMTESSRERAPHRGNRRNTALVINDDAEERLRNPPLAESSNDSDCFPRDDDDYIDENIDEAAESAADNNNDEDGVVEDIPKCSQRWCVRGPTRLTKKVLEHVAKKGKIKVIVNKNKQACSGKASTLSSYLGKMTHMLIPYQWTRWNQVKYNEYKLPLLEDIRNYFALDVMQSKKYILGVAQGCWRRGLTQHIKENVEGKSMEEIMENMPPNYDPALYKKAVKYWLSDKHKRRCETNTINNSKKRIHHTLGSRSYAQLKFHMGLEDGLDLFIASHCKKGKVEKPLNKTIAKIIRKVKKYESSEALREKTEKQKKKAINKKLNRLQGLRKHSSFIRGQGIGVTKKFLRETKFKQTFRCSEDAPNHDYEKKLQDMSRVIELQDKEIGKWKDKIKRLEALVMSRTTANQAQQDCEDDIDNAIEENGSEEDDEDTS